MIKLNITKFKNDIKGGILQNSYTEHGSERGYNLSNYIYNEQKNTKIWDYVNKDVYIFISTDGEYNIIEDYGNGVPDWAYSVIKDITKIIKEAK